MTKIDGKIWLSLGLLVVIVIVQIINWQTYLRRARLVFIDVGQGDSALLVVRGQVVIIDGGPDNSLLYEIGRWLPYFEKKIDYLIISHDHDDHVTGLIELLGRYQVQHIIYGAKIESAMNAKYFRSQASDRQIETYQVTKTASIQLSEDCRLEILNPESLEIKSDENNSLVIQLACYGQKILFMGDNSSQVESALLNAGLVYEVDILKAGHHGSKTSSRVEFLEQTSPRQLVISVGAKNTFNHPHPDVLSRAIKVGATVRRTDQEGSLIFELFSP